MPDVIDMTARRVLTEEDFDKRLEAIEARVAELEEEKNASRGQELARLFYRSGWTRGGCGAARGPGQLETGLTRARGSD
ncbi:MAG: hypothetical protein LJE91_16470 [Gammaproteobacteria bacterium]|jgi:hypothetical protein|nr:hypothetical protein [Gammaproteobacteria bacterium]